MKRTKRFLGLTALALCTALLLASPAFATPGVSALSSHGDLYKARVGTVSSLFPNAPKMLHDHTAIALEIRRAGEEPEWLLVPTTQGPEVESQPFLLVEGRANGVHLIWESRRNYIYSRINLASYVDGEWSDVIELSGEIFSQKSAPRISVTRDSYVEVDPETGVAVTFHLTNFHTVWFEDASTGRQAVYSLVQFRNGIYQGPNHVFPLGQFDTAEGDGLPTQLSHLLEAPTVVAGRDDEHAVAAFADLESGRLATLEFATVPHELVSLAEKVRSNITDIGFNAFNKQEVAISVQQMLLDHGTQIHPDFLNYLSTQIYAMILGLPEDTTINQVGYKVRSNITDIGARLTVLGKNVSQLNEITSVEIPSSNQGGLSSLLMVRLGSSRPAPEVGGGSSEVTLYPSPNGSDVIAAWLHDSALYYVESVGDGWSQIRSLELGEDLDLADAHQLLERRSRDR